jgi:aspartyl protease
MGRISRLLLVGLLGIAPSCATERPSRTVTVPFRREHGLLFLEIEGPEDPPLLALVDTGANASAIDPRRSTKLSVVARGEVQGTTGSLDSDVVEVTGLWLGDLAIRPLRATRRDLSGLLPLDGRPVDMVLGSDAFVGLALTFDFRSREILVSNRSPASMPEGVPMLLDEGIPAIPATIGGVQAMLRIDTGASLFDTDDVYVNIPSRAWSALLARDPALAPSTHFRGTGANGEAVELPVARVRGARIGERTLDSVFVIVQPEAGYFARPDAKGFVGVNFLEKLVRVTLDYGGGRFAAWKT